MSNRSLIVIGLIALALLALWCTWHHRDVWQPAPIAAAPATPPPALAPAPAPPAPAPKLDVSALWQSGQLTLSGAVPSEAVRAAMVASAIAGYGEGNVIDKLTVDAAMARAVGADKLGSFPPALKQFVTGQARFDGEKLRVTGEAESEGVRDAALATMTQATAGAYAIESDIKVAAAPKGAEDLQARLDREMRLDNVEFDTGSANLTAQGKSVLDRVVPLLKAVPDAKVRIEGHTDSRGSETGNLKLSQARADTVRRYLVAAGIDAKRLSAKGFGSSKPIARNDTDEGRARNRRIEFRL